MRKLSGGDEAPLSETELPAGDAPAAAAPAAVPTEEWPSSGGCWIRQPDGSLVRDRSEHPEEEA